MSLEAPQVEDVEVQLLLDGVFRRYGYDFREYARPSLARRIRHFVRQENLPTISALQERVLHEPACMERLLAVLAVNVSAMFRDPSFFHRFRTRVLPILRTYPFIRIWHAGCSTGEEVYSLAILLHEEGLYERCRIYATDISEVVLDRAKSGVFPLRSMREYTDNYIKSGGASSFSDYYASRDDEAILRQSLRKNIVFAQHNLATDSVLNEFHLILCRNVMIYFNRLLQERVHKLLYESLVMLGFLGLGSKESLRFSPHEARYEGVSEDEKLYRKVG